jgi:hypothetical protein
MPINGSIAPPSKVYQCPDCAFYSFIGTRMNTHSRSKNHGEGVIVPMDAVIKKPTVTMVKPAPPLPPLHPVTPDTIAPTLPSFAALEMEREAGLIAVLARLSNDERLQVLAAIDLAFAQRNAVMACLKTVNMALSQCTDKGTGLDRTLCAMLADRTSKILKLTTLKKP